MTDKIDNRYTFQQEARMIFGNLITPAKVGKKGQGKGEPVYSASVLLKPDSPDLTGLKAVAARVAKAQWPGRNLGELKFPFSSGEKEAEKAKAKGKDGSFYLGHVLFKAYTGEQYPPALVVPAGGQLKVLEGPDRVIIGKVKFYNGCKVGLAVSFKAYNGQDDGGVGPQSGVKAWLSSVVWLGDGDRIGGRATETFRHFAGAVSAENPLGDEEIPF
jgi:hypothetical protein